EEGLAVRFEPRDLLARGQLPEDDGRIVRLPSRTAARPARGQEVAVGRECGAIVVVGPPGGLAQLPACGEIPDPSPIGLRRDDLLAIGGGEDGGETQEVAVPRVLMPERDQELARAGVPDPPLRCDGLAVRRVDDVFDVAFPERGETPDLPVLRHAPEADPADLLWLGLHQATDE